MKKSILIITLFILIINCSNIDEPITSTPLEFSYDFTPNSQNWQSGFADYPEGQESFYELEYEHSTLPAPLDESNGSLKQSGNNHSDDLFMFIKRKISGLKPYQTYKATFNIEIATNIADNLFGVGGSPGHSVYIKAGLTKFEPLRIVDDLGFYRINIDKSNQAQSGNDMIVIGDFSNGTNQNIYKLKSLTNHNKFIIQADKNGELWTIIGTDSGFEATTTIYYNKISILLEE